MLLEAGLDRGLDLVDPRDCGLDLGPRRPVEKRDARAGPGGVARAGHLVERHVRDHPQNHCVKRADMGPKGTGQNNRGDRVGTALVHQQTRTGVEGGLGQLDRADVALCDRDDAVPVAVQDVGVGPAVRLDAVGADLTGRADEPGRVHDARHPHLGNRLDDARAADPGHFDIEIRVVRPQL